MKKTEIQKIRDMSVEEQEARIAELKNDAGIIGAATLGIEV